MAHFHTCLASYSQSVPTELKEGWGATGGRSEKGEAV
jgi:hypothetical protein